MSDPEESSTSDSDTNESEYTGLSLSSGLTYTGIFLFFAGIFIAMFSAFSCTSDVLNQAMTFSANIPDGTPVSDWIQGLFKTCMVNRVVNIGMLFSGSVMSGFLTLTLYTWYNIDISFEDWLGILK